MTEKVEVLMRLIFSGCGHLSLSWLQFAGDEKGESPTFF